jgi:hypothetical protein
MICPCLTHLDRHQAIAELSDVALGLAGRNPALLTIKRGSARVCPHHELAPARLGPLPTEGST